MKLREVKIGVRVIGRRRSDGNIRIVGMAGKIVGCGSGTIPLVRFNLSVGGHGYKNREWFCGYRDLQVIP